MICFVFQVLDETITPTLRKLKEVWKNYKNGRALNYWQKILLGTLNHGG